MPAAMHAALEKEADKRGLTGEQRDAFIYGTMRKTGWKPKREVDKSSKRERRLSIPTMNTTRLDRLIALNAHTSDIVEFKKLWDPETEQWVDDGNGTGMNRAANLAVGAGVLGVGGYAGQRAVSNAGGYGAVATNVRNKIAPVVAAAGPKIATASTAAATKVASLLSRLKKVRFESREQRLVHLNSQADEIIEFRINPLAVIGGTLAGGQIGRAIGKKKWNPSTGKWEDGSGKQSRVNYAVEAGSLTGAAGVIGAQSTTVRRKGAAAKTAFGKTMQRGTSFHGVHPLRAAQRGIRSAAKAARYA